MCCIVHKPKGVDMPAKNIIQYLAFRNHDGFGYVTSDGKDFKSTDFDEFYARLQEDAKTENEVLIHFRWGTHGSTCRDNCHPFYSAKHKVWFMHNGILPIRTANNMTDSETMFRKVFVKAADKYGYGSFEFWHIVRENAFTSRFAFMHDGKVQRIGNFYESDGCYYSNPSGIV